MTHRTDSATEVVQAVEKANAEDDTLIKFSTGVVLRGLPASPVTLVKVLSLFPRPEPPTMVLPGTNKEVPNIDDKDYAERLSAWRSQYANAMMNALILLGTEIVSVPKGIPSPDDEEWIADMRLIGLPVDDSHPRWRYLNWVQTVAMKTNGDMERLMYVVGRMSGVAETDVKAAASFRGSDEENQS